MGDAAFRTFPLSPGGHADGMALPTGTVELIDCTADPRFGIKGPGSAAWTAAQGIALPEVNGVAAHAGLRILRLGAEDLLFTGEACEPLAARWRAGSGARGYWSWREEGWAWMRLAGPLAGEAMARLCAVDLREGRFAGNALAQTRVAGIEAVVLRAEQRFEIFFDIASTAYFVRCAATAAERAARAAGPASAGREVHA